MDNAKINIKKTPEFKARLRAFALQGGKNRKGTKNKTTLEREKVLEMAKNIVAGRTKALIDTQTILATGGIKIFKIIYDIKIDYVGTGKNKQARRTRVARKPVIVSREDEITAVLDHEYGDGKHTDEPNSETEFFFIVTKDPDNQAINSLLDRTFGKATETIKTSSVIEVKEEHKALAKKALAGLI